MSRILEIADAFNRGEMTEEEMVAAVEEAVGHTIDGALKALNDLRAHEGKPPVTEADLLRHETTRDPFPWEM